jgi:hypothetical protein
VPAVVCRVVFGGAVVRDLSLFCFDLKKRRKCVYGVLFYCVSTIAKETKIDARVTIVKEGEREREEEGEKEMLGTRLVFL